MDLLTALIVSLRGIIDDEISAPSIQTGHIVSVLYLQGLMKANEEFATEVTHLYEEEEKWREEKQELEQNLANTKVELNNQLESVQQQLRQEREKMEGREENLLESVKMLSHDNARLIKEREEEQINQSKSHQVISNTFNSVNWTKSLLLYRSFNYNLMRRGSN